MKQYNQANLWKNLLQEKEEKKAFIKPFVVETTVSLQAPMIDLSHNRTVFSRNDLGHCDEETIKIKQIYKELENIFLPQRVAF